MVNGDSNDSMTVSGSSDNGGRGTGPEGNGDSGGSYGGRARAVNFSKTPEKQTFVNPYLLAIPANLAIIEGTWGGNH